MNSSIHSVFYLSNRAGQEAIAPNYLDVGMGGHFEGCKGCKSEHRLPLQYCAASISG